MDLLETQVSDLRTFLGAGGLPSATNTTATASSTPNAGIGTAAAALQQVMSGSTPGASGGASGLGLGSVPVAGLTQGGGSGTPHSSTGYSLPNPNPYNSHHHSQVPQHLQPLRDFGSHDFASGPIRGTAESTSHGGPRPSIAGSTTASLTNNPHDPYRRNSSAFSPRGDSSAQNDMNHMAYDSPAAQSDTQDHPTGQASRHNSTTSGSAAKRKAAGDDDGASASSKQQRSKRNRVCSFSIHTALFHQTHLHSS